MRYRLPSSVCSLVHTVGSEGRPGSLPNFSYIGSFRNGRASSRLRAPRAATDASTFRNDPYSFVLRVRAEALGTLSMKVSKDGLSLPPGWGRHPGQLQ
jgi:hypothetical protein